MMRKMKFFGLLLSFLLLIGTGIGLSAAFGDITVKLTYNVDNVDIEQADFSQAHGTTLTHEAPLNVGDNGEFNYWLVNGILRTDLARNLSIVTRSTTELVAVYGHLTNATVTFIDSNGKYINHLFVESGSVVAEASVPAAPGKPQSTFAGWKGLGSSVVITDEITSNTVFIATYTENAVTAELVVDGGTPTPYPINSVVSLTLGEGFTHWEDGDGNILSYAETFSFSMLVANREVVRATGGVKAPVVNMIAETGLREGYTSYIGQFDSNGLDVIEYGFIISRSKDILTIDSLGATIIPSNVYNEQTNEFLRSFPEDSYNSIRAYAVFNDGTNQVIEYSDKMVGGQESVYATDLFISEYIEGSSSNKAIEIYNGTGSPVNLSTYKVKLYANGATAATNTHTFAADKVLAHGQTVVLVNSGADAAFKVLGSIDSSVANFNGDDAIGLYKNEVLIDVFGIIGKRENYGTDKTLVRNSSVISPVSTWNSNEWDVYPKDTFTHLGSHVMGGSFIPQHEIVSIVDGLSTVSFVNEGSSIPNPTKEGHTFNGWFLEDTFINEFTGPINQSLTLYAKFTINNYTLSFNTDGGSPIESINQPFGSTIVAPEEPVKEGYTFNGWSPALPAIIPAENQEFTALWVANDYTITFNTNGGDTIAPLTQAYGTSLSLPVPTKTGYNFDRWFTDVALEVPFTETTMPAQDFTLYAAWVDASSTSIVTFETNGGTPPTFTVTVTNGQPVAEPEEPTKEGFTFDGWFSDELLTVPYVVFSTSVTTDITLYAKWQAKPTLLYSYNFLDGGSNNNSAYANTGLTTNVSYASDNPGGTSGTTAWKADYANLNLTNATRLGGKLVSTEHGSPNANIRTNFTFSETLTKVEITGASAFGTAGNLTNIYLQTSTNGTTWTTISSTKTVAPTITFDGLNISSGSYIRITIELKASGTNSGLAFTGIKVTGTK